MTSHGVTGPRVVVVSLCVWAGARLPISARCSRAATSRSLCCSPSGRDGALRGVCEEGVPSPLRGVLCHQKSNSVVTSRARC